MESPYNRPVAANLIDKVLTDHEDFQAKNPEFCGLSREMVIYIALKDAGYLTEEAMRPNENPRGQN